MQNPDAMVAEFAMTVLGFPRPGAQTPACNPREPDEEQTKKPAKASEKNS
jgi:hypothetical protein